MPSPGAGGVQTSLVGRVQSMMATARSALRRKPGAPVESPGDKNNPADLSQFADIFEPSGGLFAPGYPLPPEPIGFAELRALAQNHDITRLCTETRKDQIEALDWQIRSRDEKNPRAGAEERAGSGTWAPSPSSKIRCASSRHLSRRRVHPGRPPRALQNLTLPRRSRKGQSLPN